jgi:hypothetical protein
LNTVYDSVTDVRGVNALPAVSWALYLRLAASEVGTPRWGLVAVVRTIVHPVALRERGEAVDVVRAFDLAYRTRGGLAVGGILVRTVCTIDPPVAKFSILARAVSASEFAKEVARPFPGAKGGVLVGSVSAK